jgi:ankyrin repeat protein
MDNNTRALHKAAEEGDLAEVERLLAADPYLVKNREEYKRTPLHRAAMAGHAAVARAMLGRSAEVNAKDYGGATPLHVAAAAGHRDAAAALLERKADPNAKDLEDLTPLHFASRAGHEDVVALLLDKGADPNIRAKLLGTPLHEAAEHGHLGIVQLLLKQGGLANARSGGSPTPWTPWHAAKEAGHGAIADLLRSHGGQDRGAAAVSIHSAAEHGYLGRLEVLLKEDPALIRARDVVHRRTALHWAANNGHLKAAELLLAHGADAGLKDWRGETPLDRAQTMGHPKLVALLKKQAQ